MENMDAAFIWEKNYKAYFFKGWEYWRYDEISNRVDPGYPKNISIWGKCLVVFVTIEGLSRKKKLTVDPRRKNMSIVISSFSLAKSPPRDL